MDTVNRKVTLELTETQYDSLQRIAADSGDDATIILGRIVDAALISRTLHFQHEHDAHRQTLQLLVALMKMLGQVLYFVSLPLTLGPVKGKLTSEGIATHWRQSEKFATELLAPGKQSAKTGV